MKDKFAEFLKIASQLNKMGIVPLLMGSLGLEQVTGQDWQARDIDIHVHGDKRDFQKFCKFICHKTAPLLQEKILYVI